MWIALYDDGLHVQQNEHPCSRPNELANRGGGGRDGGSYAALLSGDGNALVEKLWGDH